ncbi:hypothetical protein [Kineosporia babensis]|uniref:Uncharacterized protein n=1 Tax=Kineosporia babensis TaxID=499548 RepID=A0A9X1SWN8_9ACTN|nr:hypothetical protein [Kineosporia babensis]MCD5309598.1 hypothetical protein [Kineosporia babensis]
MESVTIQGGAPPRPLSQELLSDIAFYAQELGAPLEVLAERFRGTEEFVPFAEDLEADPSYVVHGLLEDGNMWIRFTDRPEDDLLKRLETELSIQIDVQWGAPLNGPSLVAISETMFRAVVDFPGVVQVGSGLSSDQSGDVIQIRYRLAPDTTVDVELLQQQALRAGAAASPSGAIPVAVDFAEDPELDAQLQWEETY